MRQQSKQKEKDKECNSLKSILVEGLNVCKLWIIQSVTESHQSTLLRKAHLNVPTVGPPNLWISYFLRYSISPPFSTWCSTHPWRYSADVISSVKLSIFSISHFLMYIGHSTFKPLIKYYDYVTHIYYGVFKGMDSVFLLCVFQGITECPEITGLRNYESMDSFK